ncbi:MAG: hypothetical protein U9Q37_06445, partial [Euryarchaeota archaeon]|nr:hypothetical protein [Euryarchaeota archaeon]
KSSSCTFSFSSSKRFSNVMVTALMIHQPPYIRYLSYHQHGTLNILFDMAVNLTWRYATTLIFPDIRAMAADL